MSDVRNSRFSDMVPQKTLRDTPVQIFGCGAVGRAVGMLLAQMGVRHVHLHDPDRVEEANMGPQGWDQQDLGQLKVAALRRAMTAKWPRTQRTRLHYNCYPEPVGLMPLEYPNNDKLRPQFTFLCVDSIPARRACWGALTNVYSMGRTGVADARVQGEVGRIITDVLSLWGTSQYPSTLPEDANVQEGPCGTKMTPYGAQFAACLLVRAYCAYLRREFVFSDTTFNLAEPHVGPTPEVMADTELDDEDDDLYTTTDEDDDDAPNDPPNPTTNAADAYGAPIDNNDQLADNGPIETNDGQPERAPAPVVANGGLGMANYSDRDVAPAGDSIPF